MRKDNLGQWYEYTSGAIINLKEAEQYRKQFKNNQQEDRDLKREVYELLDIEYKPDEEEQIDIVVNKIMTEMHAHRDRLIKYQEEEEKEVMITEQKPILIKDQREEVKVGENSIEMIDEMFSVPDFKGKK